MRTCGQRSGKVTRKTTAATTGSDLFRKRVSSQVIFLILKVPNIS